MKKFRGLLCSLLLVPCVLVGTGCGKESKMSLEYFSKATKDAGEKFYTHKFYPNNVNKSLVFPGISFELTKEITDYSYEYVEYNHKEEEGDSVSYERENYTKKVKTVIESKVSINPIDDSDIYEIEIEVNERRIINGKKASEDDLSVVDFETVITEKSVTTFYPTETGAKVFLSEETWR